LEDATYKAIDSIFNGYAEDGFSPIEISQIMINTIMTKESLYILERNRKMVSKNKRGKNEF